MKSLLWMMMFFIICSLCFSENWDVEQDEDIQVTESLTRDEDIPLVFQDERRV